MEPISGNVLLLWFLSDSVVERKKLTFENHFTCKIRSLSAPYATHYSSLCRRTGVWWQKSDLIQCRVPSPFPSLPTLPFPLFASFLFSPYDCGPSDSKTDGWMRDMTSWQDTVNSLGAPSVWVDPMVSSRWAVLIMTRVSRILGTGSSPFFSFKTIYVADVAATWFCPYTTPFGIFFSISLPAFSTFYSCLGPDTFWEKGRTS